MVLHMSLSEWGQVLGAQEEDSRIQVFFDILATQSSSTRADASWLVDLSLPEIGA